MKMLIAGDGPVFCEQYIDVDESPDQSKNSKRKKRARTDRAKLQNVLAQKRYRNRKRLELEELKQNIRSLEEAVAYWREKAELLFAFWSNGRGDGDLQHLLGSLRRQADVEGPGLQPRVSCDVHSNLGKQEQSLSVVQRKYQSQ